MPKKRPTRKKSARSKSKVTRTRTKKLSPKKKPVRSTKRQAPPAEIHQGVSAAQDVITEAESETLEETEEYGGES